MAMIDYGAVVIKNGLIINENQFFMDMEKSVGWVDTPRIRYPDCSNVEQGKSNCWDCPRAIVKHYNDPDIGQWSHTIGDCRCVRFSDLPAKIDGNWFAYIGDEHLTICVYKTYSTFLVDKVTFMNYIGCRKDGTGINHKSCRFQIAGARVVLRALSPLVMHMAVDYDGNHYHIIYGYGIDPNLGVWNKVKKQYLGPVLSQKVDRLYARLRKTIDA